MSTLVLVLAAMAVPGNGPENVSAQREQDLDLRGEWEGLWVLPDGEMHWSRWGEGELHLYSGEIINAYLFTAANEGGGNLSLCLNGEQRRGISQQQGDRLVICFNGRNVERPTSFRAGNGQHLLILHRVKPRK